MKIDYKIPLKKQSKKNRKSYYSGFRKIWSINPVSKICPDKKKNFKEEIEISEYL